MLLESLVGVLLLGIVGMGMTYTATRVAVAQRYAMVQNLAVNEMRRILAQGHLDADSTPLCDASSPATLTMQFSPSSAAISLPMTIDCTSTAVTVAGTTLSAPAPDISLSITSTQYFGGAGTVTVGS